jgi:hypothetical protein
MYHYISSPFDMAGYYEHISGIVLDSAGKADGKEAA